MTGGLIPLFCLEGVPAFPGASEDEAGLTRIFEKDLCNYGTCLLAQRQINMMNMFPLE